MYRYQSSDCKKIICNSEAKEENTSVGKLFMWAFIRVLNVVRRQAKPSCGVLWDLVTEDMLLQMPILTRLQSCPSHRVPKPGMPAVDSANPDEE